MIGEMSGGQHRVDEVTGTELVGWTGQEVENCSASLAEKQASMCGSRSVCERKKKELNTLDEADFLKTVIIPPVTNTYPDVSFRLRR
jgi:hypothetical protein